MPTRLGRLAVRAWGEGPTLVLLHGATGSWRHWARNIAPLAATHRVVAVDLPGTGDSDMPAHKVDRPAVAAAVSDAIEAVLGDGMCDLVGFSFGGAVAGLTAGLLPRRLRSLTLVSAGGFGPPVPELERYRVRHLEGEARMAAHRANLLSLMIAQPSRLDALALEIQDQNSRRSRLRRPADRAHPYLPGALDGFRGAVNAVWGERDRFLLGHLPARVALLRAARPEASVLVIPGAGHWVAYEAAERFNAWLLERLGGGDGAA